MLPILEALLPAFVTAPAAAYRLVRSGLPIRRIGFQPRVRVGDLRAWIRQTPIVGM